MVATDMVQFNSNRQPVMIVSLTSVGGDQVAMLGRRGQPQLPFALCPIS